MTCYNLSQINKTLKVRFYSVYEIGSKMERREVELLHFSLDKHEKCC